MGFEIMQSFFNFGKGLTYICVIKTYIKIIKINETKI